MEIGNSKLYREKLGKEFCFSGISEQAEFGIRGNYLEYIYREIDKLKSANAQE